MDRRDLNRQQRLRAGFRADFIVEARGYFKPIPD